MTVVFVYVVEIIIISSNYNDVSIKQVAFDIF